MIAVGPYTFDLNDPATLLAAGAVLLTLIAVLLSLRKRGDPRLAQALERLDAGQHQLAGGLNTLAEGQASQQAQTLQVMEQRPRCSGR